MFKFPSVEPTTYDRSECSAKNQIYPLLGEKAVGDITSADIKNLLNYWMNKGYAYTTVKKAYVVLNEYFRYLYREELIPKNPMANVEMIKKSNFLSAQNKENLPNNETVTIFTAEEIEKFKKECFKCWGTGKRLYQQSAAYILMLNTGLRTGELLKNQNISDFYDLSDELKINANSSKATDEDKLKYKYISSVQKELSDLYKTKRELQNSNGC